MAKLSRKDPDFFSKLSRLRKRKVGGQYFKKNRDAAREAGSKGGKSKRKPKLEDRVMSDYLDDLDVQ